MGKAKAEKPDKPGQLPSAKPKKPTAEEVLAIMQKLAKNGIGEVSSRLVSDKLELKPDYGRQQVRQIMKRLAANGKVKITEKKVKRKQYVYSLKITKEMKERMVEAK